jgi:hypothetical protein
MSDAPSNRHFARIAADFTPFAAPSCEPRFALELPFTDAESIGDGLRCAELAAGHTPRAWIGYTDDLGKWLAVCSAGSPVANFPTLSTLLCFEDLDRREAAIAIRRWLVEKADYTEEPDFEGSAMRGMRMFHVAYGQDPQRFYGWTVIQPHWFEVHK